MNKPTTLFLLLGLAFSGALYYFVSTAMQDETTLSGRQSVVIYEKDYVKIGGAVLHTEAGDITLRFDDGYATKTIANFIRLAHSGFYEGTKFHKVIKNFLIQGGDPLTKGADTSKYGTGGPGYTFKDELSNLSMIRGTIAMANTRPNANGSQFFILTEDNKALTGKYTVFGYIADGMDNVDAISHAPTAGDLPVNPIGLKSVDLTE